MEPATPKPSQQIPTHPAVAPMNSAPPQPLVRSFNNSKKNSKMMPQMFLIGLVVVVAGLGTGYFLSQGATASNKSTPTVTSNDKKATGAQEEGVEDMTAFPDTAEGVLEEGGIEGEGSYHLVRDGGPSKYVYLGSTVLNLETYKGKKVQVWGQTISGRKAGWLMDVGKIKILD